MGILSTLLTPAAPSASVSSEGHWINRAIGARTFSGTTVTEQSALQVPAVFAAIRIISDLIAQLPAHIYERTSSGRRATVSEHPAVWMLKAEANPHMSAFVFRNVAQGHCLGWGNGYAEIERNGRGQAVRLWPLLPDRTEPHVEKGQLDFRTTIDGRAFRLNPENVVHVPGFGFDGYRGYSPIWLARQAIGLALATEEFGAKFFGQGSRSGGVLKLPKMISPEAEARMVDAWSGGLEESHRIRILYEGSDFSQTTIPPEDAQFLQTRKFQLTEVARIFGIPPHKLADLDRATFSNIEHQSLELVTDSLQPWITRWEQELDRKLFLGAERGRFYVKLNVNALLRGDMAARANFYKSGINDGWLTRNEARDFEDMNPIDGLDAPMRPLNMVEQGEEIPE